MAKGYMSCPKSREARSNPKQSLKVECCKELSLKSSKLAYRINIYQDLQNLAKSKHEIHTNTDVYSNYKLYIIIQYIDVLYRDTSSASASIRIYTDSPRIARTNWSCCRASCFPVFSLLKSTCEVQPLWLG
jgi:hypothetical protein